MINFLRFTLIIVFCIFLFSGQGIVYGKDIQNKIDLNQLDTYFSKALRDWKVPGMAISIVKDGKAILSKGYGVKTFSNKEKVDENTLFAIASNTKAFGSAALSVLVDEGKITWDDRVQKYLPFFKLYDPYVSAEITIRDLLCHRSGLKTFSGDLLWYETRYTPIEIIKRMRYLKQSFGFRSGFGYSNLMYIVAGEVVAAVTGSSWKEFVKERIFKPLHMTRSNIGTSELKKYENIATPHYINQKGKTLTVSYTSSDNTGAAAAINSSVKDMAQWIKMLLNKGKYDGKQILSERALEEMWRPFNSFKVDSKYRKLFPSTHFRSYGLGWGMFDYKGVKVLSHGGALDGMISLVALVPEKELGIVILTNSINGLPRPLMYKIIDTFLKCPAKDWSQLYLEQNKKKRKADKKLKKTKKLPKFQKNLKEYIGLYGGELYGDAKISLKKNKLVLNLLPSPIFLSDLTPLYYDTFLLKLRNKFSFIPAGEGTVQFLRDKTGKIIEMKIDIPNNDFYFTELEFKKKNI